MSATWQPVEDGVYGIVHIYRDMIAFRDHSSVTDLPDDLRLCRRVEAEPSAAELRVVELEALIAYIDAHVPVADDTCNEPGILFSEACRRAMRGGEK